MFCDGLRHGGGGASLKIRYMPVDGLTSCMRPRRKRDRAASSLAMRHRTARVCAYMATAASAVPEMMAAKMPTASIVTAVRCMATLVTIMMSDVAASWARTSNQASKSP